VRASRTKAGKHQGHQARGAQAVAKRSFAGVHIGHGHGDRIVVPRRKASEHGRIDAHLFFIIVDSAGSVRVQQVEAVR
jgi:hypothetical protein